VCVRSVFFFFLFFFCSKNMSSRECVGRLCRRSASTCCVVIHGSSWDEVRRDILRDPVVASDLVAKATDYDRMSLYSTSLCLFQARDGTAVSHSEEFYNLFSRVVLGLEQAMRE
jgi:hypothetical protein